MRCIQGAVTATREASTSSKRLEETREVQRRQTCPQQQSSLAPGLTVVVCVGPPAEADPVPVGCPGDISTETIDTPCNFPQVTLQIDKTNSHNCID